MSSREVKKTEAGKEYQIELLTKEISRLRKSLANQAGLLERKIEEPNGGAAAVKHELEKLDKMFTELSNASSRIIELVMEEEAKKHVLVYVYQREDGSWHHREE